MKYKQYVVTQVRISHVFVYEDDWDLDVNTIVGDLAGGDGWDVVDEEYEYVGEYEEQ